MSFFLLSIFAGTVLRPFASLLFAGIVVFSESKWHQEEHPKRATPLSLVCAVERRHEMMSIPRRLRSGCAVGTSKGWLANSFFSTALRIKQRACYGLLLTCATPTEIIAPATASEHKPQGV